MDEDDFSLLDAEIAEIEVIDFPQDDVSWIPRVVALTKDFSPDKVN